jgi:hypothetical protein
MTINKSTDVTTKNLTIEKVKELSKRDFSKVDINKLQNIIEGVLHPEKMEEWKNMKLFEKAQEIKDTIFYNIEELHEMMACLPNKPWKKERFMKLDDKEYLKKNGINMLLELSDTLFFQAIIQNSILEILNLPQSIDTLKLIYTIKYLENITRIETGVFEKQREFTKEELKIISDLEKLINE